MTRLLLLPGLALALLAGPVHGSERRPPAEVRVDAPVEAAVEALVDATVEAPVEARREVASDGVPVRAARELYDRQGNAVDRRGRILAVPESPGRPAQVFAGD